MKRWRKILFIILIVVLAIPLSIAVTVQIPAVQTAICNKATVFVNNKINGKIKIGSVHFVPFHTFIVGDVSITDNCADTLFNSDKLLVNVKGISLLSDTLVINRISIDGTSIKLTQDNSGETNFNRVLGNLFKKDTTSTSMPWDGIKLNKCAVHNLKFNFNDKYLIDKFDLAISKVTVGKGVCGTIRTLHFEEKSGLKVENLSSTFLLNSRKAILDDFEYKDNWSEIKIPTFQLEYGNPDNLKHFADSVDVKVVFDKSTLGLGSGGTFVPKFKNNPLQFFIDGSLVGKLSNIATKDLHIKTLTDNTILNISAIIKGLPDIKNSDLKCNIRQSHTTVGDIKLMLQAFTSSDSIRLPVGIKDNQIIRINCIAGANIDGIDGKLHIDADSLGMIDAKINAVRNGSMVWGGEVSAVNIDLGKFTDSKDFGKLSAFVTGWAEANPDSLRAEIVTAEVNRFDFKGYRYSDISGGCTINKNHYSGELSSLDTNLFFKLKADLMYDPKGQRTLEGSGNFSMINLGALGLTSIDTCKTRFMVDFDMNSSPDNKYIGRMEVRDMLAQLGKDYFNIGRISINSSEENNSYFSGGIECSLLSASYRGTEYITDMYSDIAELVTAQFNHVVPQYKSERIKTKGASGEFTLITGDLKPIQALIPKEIYINPGTTLKVKTDSHKAFDLSVSSQLLAFGDKFIKDMNLYMDRQNGPVNLSFTADMLQSGDMVIDRDTITACLDKNTIKAGICYNDRSKALGFGRIDAILHFQDTLHSREKIKGEILPSKITIDNDEVNINHSHFTLFRDGKINVRNFKMTDGQSHLSLNGTYGNSKQDTINMVLKDFDLTGLNFLLKKDVRLSGTVNGECRGTGLMGKDFSFLADFHGKEIMVDGEHIGDLRLQSKWNETDQRINFTLDNTLNGRRPLNMSGHYNPSKKDIYLKMGLDKFNINWIDPFMVNVLDHSQGTIDGDIEIKGKTDDLKIKSSGMRLNGMHTNLTYTEVPYILDGPFAIDENGVTISNMTISDHHGSSGKITGNYKFKGTDKGKIDLLFDLKSIQGLNTTFQSANQGFYGECKATGKVRVFGPIKGLRINLDITTEEGTVHIPLDETASVKKRDILTFVDRRNTVQSAYDSIINLRNLNKDSQGRKTAVKCNIRLKATPLTNIIVDINRANGDLAGVRGNGQVEMKTGEGQFDIRGNYLVDEGLCHFSILGITAKDFIIKEGGAINFVGPVRQTDFKLAASYQTKASIETLLGDSKSVGNRRLVNCIVNLNGKIDNPEIKFKIDIPDLDPSYKNMVESALSTDEKNLRQGLALLVSGGFIPDQQSGIVNNSTFLYSNASEIVSSQLSNIFHQLNIPIDLGLKYQPGSTGINIFDVAISTQLFNNRVTINGSIGNKEYSSTGSTNDIVGNVDVGVKLNKTGQWKLNLFSHSADVYSNYLDQSQRNGAGIIYQEEFSTFRELWNNIFKRKRKRADR